MGAVGLITVLGGVISKEDASALGKALKKQKGTMDALLTGLPEECSTMAQARGLERMVEENPFAQRSPGFGTQQEEELKLIGYLREEYKRANPTWGGLTLRDDGKFGRGWAHPKA